MSGGNTSDWTHGKIAGTGMAVVFRGRLRKIVKVADVSSVTESTINCPPQSPSEDDLRDLQDRFLRVLNQNGFFQRNKDGWSLRLFDLNDVDCPTALQVKQRLYPVYAALMQEYIDRFEKVEDLTDEDQTGP